MCLFYQNEFFMHTEYNINDDYNTSTLGILINFYMQ